MYPLVVTLADITCSNTTMASRRVGGSSVCVCVCVPVYTYVRLRSCCCLCTSTQDKAHLVIVVGECEMKIGPQTDLMPVGEERPFLKVANEAAHWDVI